MESPCLINKCDHRRDQAGREEGARLTSFRHVGRDLACPAERHGNARRVPCKGLLKEGNMVIFKDKQTNLVYVAEITYVEQDTETMGVHYYLHDVKAKETFSLDTALRDRKNFAPEYCRTQRTKDRKTHGPREHAKGSPK